MRRNNGPIVDLGEEAPQMGPASGLRSDMGSFATQTVHADGVMPADPGVDAASELLNMVPGADIRDVYPASIRFASEPKALRMGLARQYLTLQQQKRRDEKFAESQREQLRRDAEELKNTEGGMEALIQQMNQPAPVQGVPQVSAAEGLGGLVGGLITGNYDGGQQAAHDHAKARADVEYKKAVAEFQAEQQMKAQQFGMLQQQIGASRGDIRAGEKGLQAFELGAAGDYDKGVNALDMDMLNYHQQEDRDAKAVEAKKVLQSEAALKDLRALQEMQRMYPDEISDGQIVQSLTARYDLQIVQGLLAQARADNIPIENQFKRDKLDSDVTQKGLDRASRERVAAANLEGMIKATGLRLTAAEQNMMMGLMMQGGMADARDARESRETTAKLRQARVDDIGKMREDAGKAKMEVSIVEQEIARLKAKEKGDGLSPAEDARLVEFQGNLGAALQVLEFRRQALNEQTRKHVLASRDEEKSAPASGGGSVIDRIKAFGSRFREMFPGSKVDDGKLDVPRNKRGGAQRGASPSRHNTGEAADAYFESDADRLKKIDFAMAQGASLIIDYKGQRTWRPGRGWRTDPSIDKSQGHIHVEMDPPAGKPKVTVAPAKKADAPANSKAKSILDYYKF